MSFFGLMTVRAHEAAVREWDVRCASLVADRQAERETVARLVGKNANHLAKITSLLREVEGLRADVRQAEAAHDKAVAELASLRPDAEKQRERVRKASMNLKQNRAKAGVASHG